MAPSLPETAWIPSDRPSRPELAGVVLGDRFEVKRLLGEGGMARVYEAIDRTDGRLVALKVLRERLSHTPELRTRFFNEALATMRIGSDHVVEILALGDQAADLCYFAMDRLEGMPLDALCGEAQPLDDVIDIGRQLCAALHAAHQHGIVHRDLKPENVFLEDMAGARVCKVLDFGIAKLANAALTVPGSMMGTPHYMAPEQATGEVADARSDIYALGAILYELVTGEVPIDGADAMQVVMAQITEVPRPVRRLRPDCCEGLEALIARCLEKRPEARFQTACDLRRALDALDCPARTAAEASVVRGERSGICLRRDVFAGAELPLEDDAAGWGEVSIEAEVLAVAPAEDVSRTILYDHRTAPFDVADLVEPAPRARARSRIPEQTRAPARLTPTPTPWIAEQDPRRAERLAIALLVVAALALVAGWLSVW